MRPALIFAGIWFVAGAAMGLGIQSYFGAKKIVIPCGAANMLIGLVLLLIVLRNQKARRAFYGEDERGGIALAFVVGAIPTAMLMVGLIWWLLGQLFAS